MIAASTERLGVAIAAVDARAVQRLTALASVVLLAGAVLGAVASIDDLRITAVFGYASVAVGSAPAQFLRWRSPTSFLAASLIVGISVVLLWGFAMVELRWWHPVPTACAVAAATLTCHLHQLITRSAARPGRT